MLFLAAARWSAWLACALLLVQHGVLSALHGAAHAGHGCCGAPGPAIGQAPEPHGHGCAFCAVASLTCSGAESPAWAAPGCEAPPVLPQAESGSRPAACVDRNSRSPPRV